MMTCLKNETEFGRASALKSYMGGALFVHRQICPILFQVLSNKSAAARNQSYNLEYLFSGGV